MAPAMGFLISGIAVHSICIVLHLGNAVPARISSEWRAAAHVSS